MTTDPAPFEPEPVAEPEPEVREGVASRQVALSIVMQVHSNDSWAAPVADRILSRCNLDARDRSFAANLAFSTLRMEGTIDWVLSQSVTRGLEEVEDTLLDVMRIGTWELLWGHQPTHAVVDCHVEVAKAVVGERATGFVNGVLRNVARANDSLPWPDIATPRGLGLSLGYAAWVADAALARFGPERAPAVLAAGNVPAPLVLRAIAPREEVIAALQAEGIDAEPGALARDAVIISQRVVPGELGVLADNRAIVQDQASQVVGQVAADGLPAGAIAIDLCAAPGGKATHLAQQGLTVTAVDRHAGRLRQTAALAARLNLPLDTLLGDGATVELPEGGADLVLVDAPCSGLGVVRRRPELRWRRRPGDIESLGAVQLRLLQAAITYVRPGGRVVYSVCTWTGPEADDVVAKVIEAGLVDIQERPSVGIATEYGSQMAPDADEADGMFLAVMTRAKG